MKVKTSPAPVQVQTQEQLDPWILGRPFEAPAAPVVDPDYAERVDHAMELISVRRQRKLKMKKHKYKKLMKNTRNLRRRIERQKN